LAIKLYRYVVRTEDYEDAGFTVSEATHARYKKPLYTTSIYQVFCLKARYGEEYVSVCEADIDVEWLPVTW